MSLQELFGMLGIDRKNAGRGTVGPGRDPGIFGGQRSVSWKCFCRRGLQAARRRASITVAAAGASWCWGLAGQGVAIVLGLTILCSHRIKV
jgi:hypothetical protein